MESQVLAQFNVLIQELLSGGIRRHTLAAWEVELLIDMHDCRVRRSSRASLLRRYQRAVQKQFAAGTPGLIKFSEYLASTRSQRAPAPASRSAAGLCSN